MKRQAVSIFNDVIGPIMRGPSSSHTAASVRIGQIARQLVQDEVDIAVFEFHLSGSLATTYHGHGSDRGLIAGLLGYQAYDEELLDIFTIACERGLVVEFKVLEYEASHPNTYRMILVARNGERIHATALSLGGGMIEFICIEGFNVSIQGDFYETLLFVDKALPICWQELKHQLSERVKGFEYGALIVREDGCMINIKTSIAIHHDELRDLKKLCMAYKIITLLPILPVLSSNKIQVPFTSAQEMMQKFTSRNYELWQMAAWYESARGGMSREAVFNRMKSIVNIMLNSVERGIIGTEYSDRILKPQAYLMQQAKHRLIPQNILNAIIESITALMEMKSAMGVIVAAPTAGSCGALPGTIIGASKNMGFNVEDMTKAMLAAAMVGVFIAENATFAAEVGGCQAECGAGSAMAAAGLVQLYQGTVQEAIDAASMALQNMLGMVCDPVAERVEVPCLGKNVMAGVNALACANMALAGFDKIIPLDETIKAMYQVGQMLPSALRCTGKAGLSITKTAKCIEKTLKC